MNSKVHPYLLRTTLLGVALGFPFASASCAAPAPTAATSNANSNAATLLSLPTPPVINADTRDWPKDGVQTLKGPDGSATFQIAGDSANFYALVQVQDKSPLKNSAVRGEELWKGGDAIAFYFGGSPETQQRVIVAQRDGQDEVWVYRPQSRVKKPYTFSSPVGQTNFDYVAPLEGAQVAQRGNDKRGEYTLEIAIPWKSLGLAGLPVQFPFQLQVVFSDAGGTTNISSAWWHGDGGAGNTIEDLPTEAKLYPASWGVAALVGVDVGANNPVAAAVPGIPIRYELPRAGRVSLSITDSSGWIVRELIVAENKAKGVHTVEWDGRDRYGEPLPPGKYGWKALLFDGMGVKFMGSVGSSGRPAYRTPDGLGSMGGQHGVPGALAADGGGIYLASGAEEGTPAMRKMDAKTGQAQWKRSMGGFGAALAVAADEGFAAILNQGRDKSKNKIVDFVRIDPETGRDVKMGDDKKSVSRLTLEMKVPERPKTDDEEFDKLPFIGGMAIAGKRAFWSVTAQNKIGGINLETGELLPDISVKSPLGLARFDANTLLVGSGTGVVKLDLKSGKTAPLISGLQMARAVALDKSGDIYVSDLGQSQQIKKFSSAGKLLASWGKAGGKPTNMPVYDPLVFDNVSALATGPDGNLWLSESAVTPKRFVKLSSDGKWLEDFYGPVAYNTFGPDLDDASVVYYNSGGNQGGAQIIETKVNYDKYAENPNDPVAAWRIVAIHDMERGNPVMGQVARTGYGHYFAFTADNGKKYLFRPSKHNRATVPPGAGLWLWEKNRWVAVAFLSRDEAKEKSWSDRNGDGLMQDGERFEIALAQEYSWINRDLSLDGFSGKLAPTAVDARGVPQYQGGKYAPYLAPGEPAFPEGWTFVSPADKDAVYYVSNIGPHRHLGFWDRASENRVFKVADGKVQWIVGGHAPNATFTDFNTLTGVAGTIDDITLVHTVDPNYYAFTSDGFNLGNVMAGADGEAPRTGPTAVTIESFTGLYVRDPKMKKNLLFSVSSGDDRILEVVGPGQTTRLNGEITLDTTRPGLPMAAPTIIAAQTNYGSNSTSEDGVDGEDWNWQPDSLGLPIYRGDQLIGDVRLRRDAGTLWIFANVLQTTPLQNGEGVELQLAPREGGKETTIFLAATPSKDGELQARAMLDGTDVTLPLRGKATDKIEVAAATRWRGLGYRLEARVPLSLFPQLSAPRPQEVTVKVNKQNQTTTETLPDLSGPLRLKASVISNDNGAPQRASWPAKEWGVALTP